VIGVAWAPDPRHVVRAAYGLFYGTTPAGVCRTGPKHIDGVNTSRSWCATLGQGIPVIPAAFSSMPALDPLLDRSDRTDVSTGHECIKRAYGWETEKYRVGCGPVEYLFARENKLPRAMDINANGRFPAMGPGGRLRKQR
jgi:hypothetical protein